MQLSYTQRRIGGFGQTLSSAFFLPARVVGRPWRLPGSLALSGTAASGVFSIFFPHSDA